MGTLTALPPPSRRRAASVLDPRTGDAPGTSHDPPVDRWQQDARPAARPPTRPPAPGEASIMSMAAAVGSTCPLQTACGTYTWPSTQHSLNSMLFSVRVPVLSVNTYSTCGHDSAGSCCPSRALGAPKAASSERSDFRGFHPTALPPRPDGEHTGRPRPKLRACERLDTAWLRGPRGDFLHFSPSISWKDRDAAGVGGLVLDPV